jgi:hypothetical protein
MCVLYHEKPLKQPRSRTQPQSHVAEQKSGPAMLFVFPIITAMTDPTNLGLSAEEKYSKFLLEMSKHPTDEDVSEALKQIRIAISTLHWGTTPFVINPTGTGITSGTLLHYGSKYLERLGYVLRDGKEVGDCIRPYVFFTIDWEATER